MNIVDSDHQGHTEVHNAEVVPILRFDYVMVGGLKGLGPWWAEC